MRNRAGIILIEDDRILLMHRVKDGREYYVPVGGGVEEGETFGEAAVREAFEEVSLLVVLETEGVVRFVENGSEHAYFPVASYSGAVALGGPEAAQSSPENHYEPVWILLEQVDEITIYPERFAKHLILLQKAQKAQNEQS